MGQGPPPQPTHKSPLMPRHLNSQQVSWVLVVTPAQATSKGQSTSGASGQPLSFLIPGPGLSHLHSLSSGTRVYLRHT